MFNTLGKTLVMIHVVASLLAMTAAAGIYLQQIDWGWKEPRKYLEQRVPSEIDKRAAALEEAYKGLALVVPELKPAQEQLRAAEGRFGPNHLYYVKELARLRRDQKPIKPVKEIKMKDGRPVLDVPVIGRPEYDKDDSLIAKSYQSYRGDLGALRGEIKKVEEEIAALVSQEKELTLKLIGEKDDMGKVVRPGLYELKEIERRRATQVQFEIDYLKPRWLDTLNEAQSFRERRVDLEETLEAIRQSQGKK